MDERIKVSDLQIFIAERERVSLRCAALLALQAVNDFDPRLIMATKAWMDGSLTTDFSVDDCSLQDIIEDTGATVLEAIFMLNLQINHPEQIDLCKWVFRGDDCCGVTGV